MSKHILLLTVVASTLPACASGPPPTPVTLMPPARLPPASLMVECEAPPPPKSGALADLFANHVESMKLLHQCLRHHNELVEWERNAIRRNNNTNEPHTSKEQQRRSIGCWNFSRSARGDSSPRAKRKRSSYARRRNITRHRSGSRKSARAWWCSPC